MNQGKCNMSAVCYHQMTNLWTSSIKDIRKTKDFDWLPTIPKQQIDWLTDREKGMKAVLL